MSDITLIDDSEQSSLVTNGLAKNGELYLKKAGSTNAGSIVVYDSGVWKTFANEYAPAGFTNAYSVDFDGTNDYMEIGSSSLTDGLTTLTTSLWFNLSATQNKNLFGSRISDGGINAQIYSNDLYFTISGDGYLRIDVGTTIATNTWHHLAFVFDGSQSASADKIKGYFNGTALTQVANTITGSSITSTTANLLVGSDTLVTNAPFNGLIDEFALINSALSSSDITDIYNSGVPAALTSYSPIGWWRMGDNDGGTGTTVTDQGSGGNDGTLTNGPTFSTDVPS